MADEQNRILWSIEIDAKNAEQGAKRLADEMAFLDKGLKEVTRQYKAGQINQAQYLKESSKLKNGISTLRREQNQYNKILNATTGSLNQQRAKLALLLRQYDNMDTRTEKGRKAQAALKARIDRTTDSITKQEQATGRFQRQVGNYSKALGGLKQGFEALIGPLGAVAIAQKALQFGKEAINAADIQLQAEAKLLTALRGRVDVQNRLIDQAKEIQSRTLFGDQEVIAQQAFLGALGLTEEQIAATTEAAIQLSAATGMELESAVRNLAKTYSGLKGELGEQVTFIRDLTAEELKAGGAVDLINEKFKGFAETAARTGTGPLKQLQNILGDITEEIGKGLLPVVTDITIVIKDGLFPAVEAIAKPFGDLLSIFDRINEALPFTSNIRALQGDFWRHLGNSVANAINPLRQLRTLLGLGAKALTEDITVPTGGGDQRPGHVDTTGVGQFGLLEKLAKEGTTPAAVDKAADIVNKGIQDLKKKIGGQIEEPGFDEVTENPLKSWLELDEEDKIDLDLSIQGALDREFDAIVDQNRRIKALRDKRSEDEIKAAQAVASARLKVAQAVFDGVVQLSDEESAVHKVAMLGQKAAAIAQAIMAMSVAQAENVKAYAGIPFVGPLLAAAQGIAIAAQIGSLLQDIKNLSFADGGYTGSGFAKDINTPGRRIAGVVHDNEYVANTQSMRTPIGAAAVNTLEAIRTGQMTGFNDGGFSSRQITNGFDVESIVRATMANMPPIYVAMKDFKDAEGNYISTVQGGNL